MFCFRSVIFIVGFGEFFDFLSFWRFVCIKLIFMVRRLRCGNMYVIGLVRVRSFTCRFFVGVGVYLVFRFGGYCS